MHSASTVLAELRTCAIAKRTLTEQSRCSLRDENSIISVAKLGPILCGFNKRVSGRYRPAVFLLISPQAIMMNTSVSGQGQQYYQELISKLNLRHSALRAIRIEAQAEQSRVAQAEAKNLALTAVALKYRLQRHTGQNRGSRHGIAFGTSRTVVDLLQDTHRETARVLLKAEEISKNAQLLASYRSASTNRQRLFSYLVGIHYARAVSPITMHRALDTCLPAHYVEAPLTTARMCPFLQFES
ncbi:hypothetical protein BKA62DRAFT_668150 [Auriculariales sp. MPI-PUGE-AT-0066]|nr:hypothetical protein BKA62DRAFT_668150 [Auriculariales sp. MPI-PUGE-AT-0066]